ncbi:LOW QUALITY PROTEIN: galactose-3-O-sulfotransferase 2 [Callorhinchus milii]|uniref:LOW QUALITY PROTEIN: galactose-3-O-sulfotransferase 2 n=1 Tax=Callorhinchus milii TaxID=7868 RepID=UPI001C3FC349|nr:LOW QUALITY PROTEIN: galactose-3-O-sulfotransferase 2 [Callorhinchus milii]
MRKDVKYQKQIVEPLQEYDHNLQLHQVNPLESLLSAQKAGVHQSMDIQENPMFKYTLDQNFYEKQTKEYLPAILLKILENKSRQEAFMPKDFLENETKKSANLQLFQKEGKMAMKTGINNLEASKEMHDKKFNLNNPSDGRASEVGIQESHHSEFHDRIVKYTGKESLISSGLKALKQLIQDIQAVSNQQGLVEGKHIQGLQYVIPPNQESWSANVKRKMTKELFAVPTFVSVPSKHNDLKKTGRREEAPAYAQASCSPKTHIMFLKTHKSASSTILNILYRFGEANGLVLALPRRPSFQLGYPKFFSAKQVAGFPTKWNQYNIMCNHLRFYLPEVKKVMPEETFYFSIVRNPTTLMESSFTYYKHSAPAFYKASSLTEFVKDPWVYYNNAANNHYARNLLSFDFGFDNNANYSEKYMASIISTIETQFNLILVTEYFDESIILLKEALCWEFDDVVFFKLNIRSNATKEHLSQETIEEIKDWNAVDWNLYLHFNKTFWQKIDETIGRKRMQQEVDKLRQKQTELMKTCLEHGGAVDASKIKDKALKPFQFGKARILGYNLNPDLDHTITVKCQRLVIPELQYTKLLYDKQYS